jgi:hypothetical protein
VADRSTPRPSPAVLLGGPSMISEMANIAPPSRRRRDRPCAPGGDRRDPLRGEPFSRTAPVTIAAKLDRSSRRPELVDEADRRTRPRPSPPRAPIDGA